ncbi:unnamed protein product [Brassica napus]|nr:unnamed protein product [Brassica napus]
MLAGGFLSAGYSRVSKPLGSFDNTQPHSSFSGRFVHCPRPSPWWSAVLGVIFLPRGSAAVEAYRSQASAHQLIMLFRLFLKIPPHPLSMLAMEHWSRVA